LILVARPDVHTNAIPIGFEADALAGETSNQHPRSASYDGDCTYNGDSDRYLWDCNRSTANNDRRLCAIRNQ
jgi:hypothetical protein